MEHPIFFLTLLFEKFGMGEFAHKNPHVLYSWLIILLLLIITRLATARVKLVPGPAQNFFEVVVERIENFQMEIMGEHGRGYFPLIATIFIYILCANYMGQVPGALAPTSNINTTLSCALVVFFMTHYAGIKTHGIKYIKHFTGSIIPLMPLFFIIEVISHLSRVLSLTLRLFGNIMGEDLVLAILMFLAGKFLVPLPMIFLSLFFSGVQAFIFMLLSMMYISAALEHAH